MRCVYYVIQVKESNDIYIEAAEEAMYSLAQAGHSPNRILLSLKIRLGFQAGVPGALLVDLIPVCTC